MNKNSVFFVKEFDSKTEHSQDGMMKKRGKSQKDNE
jgi:hypothetical protein